MQSVHSIVIAGGGTAGWMCAAALSQHLRHTPCQIRLIESSEVGTVGVGESTIPSIRRFYQRLGFSDTDVIAATGASCKLGIEFVNWRQQGSSFIHPFGLFGQSLNGVPFVQCYLAARAAGLTDSIQQFSLGVAMARDNRFCLPDPAPTSMLTIFDWALHFDASRFAALLRRYAEQQGVVRSDARITQVLTGPDGIAGLQLDNGELVKGDLYIDCSGFRGLLIEQALQTGYENWQQWLLCDRAVAVQTEVTEAPVARTRATALSAGWQWRIPLQHRQGNGYVYSSQMITDDEATRMMLANTDGTALHQPRQFRFTPGRRKQAWAKNCVALGLASGFLEPLESTSIALIETGIEHLLQALLPSGAAAAAAQPAVTAQHQFSAQPAFDDHRIAQYNQISQQEYERIRDFIILHYKLNQRDDNEFWRYCAAMSVPTSLADKMAQFRQHALVPRLPREIFGEDSWVALYEGLGFLPATVPAAAQALPTAALLDELAYTRDLIQQTAARIPPHPAFLQRFCQFQPLTSA